MQVHIVTHANRAFYADEIEAMHRLRHRIFVEGLGWSDLRSADGLERDDFDDEHAVYLLAVHEDKVCGSLRLLPTWRRCMISEVWPQFVQRGNSLGRPDVWEWTRWCPGDAKSPRLLWRTRSALIVAALEFAASRKVKEYATFCETKFLAQIEELGWRPQPFGLPAPAGGSSCIALSWELRPFLLEDTCALLKVRAGMSVEKAEIVPFPSPAPFLQAAVARR